MSSRDIGDIRPARPLSQDWYVLYCLDLGERAEATFRPLVAPLEINEIQKSWYRGARLPRPVGPRAVMPSFSSNLIQVPNNQPSIVFNADKDVVISKLNKQR